MRCQPIESPGEVIQIINIELLVEDCYSFSDHEILRREVILFIRRCHGGEGVCAPCSALGQLLTLEELGEGSSALGLSVVSHVPDLDGVVRQVEADDELPLAVLTMRVFRQLGEAEVSEDPAVVVQELGELVERVLGVVELHLAPGTHPLPLLLVGVLGPGLYRGQLHALAGQVGAGEGVAVGQAYLPPVHVQHRADVEVSPVPVLPVSTLEHYLNHTRLNTC